MTGSAAGSAAVNGPMQKKAAVSQKSLFVERPVHLDCVTGELFPCSLVVEKTQRTKTVLAVVIHMSRISLEFTAKRNDLYLTFTYAGHDHLYLFVS